jgi:hypothetical protein
MANPWFRLYAEFAHDPKVQIMPEHMQRRYVMLMCLRCNGDVTLHETEIAFYMRVSESDLAETKALFLAKGFIDDKWNLLNWDKRQFASDSSAERVAKHRAKKKQNGNGDVTLRETKSNVLDTDTDTDTEPNSNHSDKDNLALVDAKAPRAPRSGQETGTRLPADWKLPKTWGEWALEERPELTAEFVRKEAEKFKDHWLANANRREGKKADWLATWRNWIRNVVLPKNGSTAAGGNGGLKPWFITANGIELKGDEAGIPRPSNEAEFPAYKAKVHAHYKISADELRKAQVDHGARA